PDNQWPPSDYTCRMGYSSRPAINSAPEIGGHQAEQMVAWGGTGSFYPFKPDSGYKSGNPETNDTYRTEMFRLNKLKSRAIVSDICSMDVLTTVGSNGATPDRTQNIHKKGLNVLYANGAAKW